MVSQVCEHCGSTVAADEQFCPECGGFIDPLSSARRSRGSNVISVTSDGPYEEFSLGQEPPPEPPRRESTPRGTGQSISCPSCGADNPPQNRHCQECGARLQQGPLPTAPRPAVQATAGVRAALGISGLLFLVILIALFFNLINGDDQVAADTTVDATATTTAAEPQAPAEIPILDAQCTPDGIGAFSCSNLYSGTEAEYQVDWEALEDAEQTVTIRLLFSEPMIVTQLVWGNIADDTRFRQNFRARGLTINAEGSLSPVIEELEDLPGKQNVDYAALNANWIEITVESAYQAQVVADNVFGELAIDEITVIGRPANPVTNTTEPEGG